MQTFRLLSLAVVLTRPEGGWPRRCIALSAMPGQVGLTHVVLPGLSPLSAGEEMEEMAE